MTEPRTRTFVRPLLWLLVALCAVGNVVTQAAQLMPLSIVFGVLVVGFSTALVVHHRRNRRPRRP